jgi:hypothetical protein
MQRNLASVAMASPVKSAAAAASNTTSFSVSDILLPPFLIARLGRAWLATYASCNESQGRQKAF